MDFIDGLPVSKRKTTLLVMVVRLSKYAYFITMSHPYPATTVTPVFFGHSFKLHSMPQSIVCDGNLLSQVHFGVSYSNCKGLNSTLVPPTNPKG